MIAIARQFDAAAKFSGSGGAIVGLLTDESKKRKMKETFNKNGFVYLGLPLMHIIQTIFGGEMSCMFRFDAKLSANRGGVEVGPGRVKWNRPMIITIPPGPKNNGTYVKKVQSEIT